MKTKLFLLAACSMLMACSSEHDITKPNPELKIKNFIRMVYHTDPSDNVTLTRTFDQSGKPVRDTEEYTNVTIYGLFTYNNSNLISEKSGHYQGGSQIGKDVFHYNSNNQIDSIISQDAQGMIMTAKYFEHYPNRITYNLGSLQGEYNYNADGVMTEINTSGDFSSSSTSITYSSNNISQIINQHSTGETETHSFQYDNELNVLFPYFHNNYFNSTIGDFGFPFNKKDYFSKNNYTQITYTHTDPSNNYTITKNTTYNSDGYPLSAEVKKDGVLIEEHVYEYY